MKSIDKHIKPLIALPAFTLVELLVSIFISVMLLGGVFYFMSDTILGIARASAHSKFLKDFYGFTTIIKTGELELIYDFPPEIASDVVLLTTVDGKSGIIIGIVNQETMKLSATGSALVYQKNSLGYRSVSPSEISEIQTTPSKVYSYDFFLDKIFSHFYMKNFQIDSFNSGSILDMVLTINPSYYQELEGTLWSDVPQDELFQYTITF